MSRSFLRGTAVGLVCAVLGGATVALAGSGVGGVFNLGVSNSVDAKTKLSGASPAAQLQISNSNTASAAAGLSVSSASSSPTGSFVNSSTGNAVSATSTSGIGVFARSSGATTPGLSARNSGGGPAATFSVNSGVAPFTVSSSTLVTALNADMVDGFHVNQIMSGGGRIAQAAVSNFGVVGNVPDTTLATLTLTAPNSGFVLVQGSVLASDAFSFHLCNPCRISVLVHDVSADVDSPQAVGELGNGSTDGYVTVPVQWVFPVTAGAHSYQLLANQYVFAGGPADLYNPVLTAEFIPFGYNGSPTSLSAGGEYTVVPRTERGPNGISRGS